MSKHEEYLRKKYYAKIDDLLKTSIYEDIDTFTNLDMSRIIDIYHAKYLITDSTAAELKLYIETKLL